MIATTFALVLVVPLPLQDVQDYDSEWIGYDTSKATEARWPWSFRAGDLDGDGDPDYAVAQGASIPGLSILRNSGYGSFEESMSMPSSTGGFWDDVEDVELVDLDRDGDLDAVLSNPGVSGTAALVSVHANNGDGTFAPFVQYATGDGPIGVTSGDLDGDGWSDIVTAGYGYIGQGDSISILANDGAGGLTPPQHVVVGPGPRRVRSEDLDGDGDADLAVALQDQELVVLLNQGGGGFASTTYSVFDTGYPALLHADVELGDVDGDGDVDAAYTSMKCGFEPFSGVGAVGVLHNLGNGTFGPPLKLSTFPETQGGVDLALADWNGDGRLDVASAHEFDGEWILFETFAGGYLPGKIFAAAASSIGIDGTDVTGDGLPDIVVLGRDSLELCVYKNPGQAAFAKNPVWAFVLTLPGIFDPIITDGLDAADVDADGDLDLGTAYHKIQGLDGGQSVLRNAGDGTFPVADVYHTSTGAANFTFAQLDADGMPDMLSTDATQGKLRRRLNNGDGSFGPEATWLFVSPFALDPGDLDAFDIDGDGDQDAAAVSASSMLFLKNDGAGGFGGTLSAHTLSTFAEVLVHGDLDGDGDEDVVTDSSFVGVETSLGNGDGTFQSPFGSTADWGIKGLVLADLDRDGVLDLATSAWSDDGHDHPTVQVLIGLGDGHFAPPATYLGSHEIGTASNAGDIVATDADGDGDLDLATGNYWSQDVSYFENRGDGTYEDQLRYGVGAPSYATAAADLDGDGVEDLAIGVTVGPSIDFYPGAVVIPSTAGGKWKDLGFGLAGALGVPELEADPLVPGFPVSLSMSGAGAGKPGAFVVGFTAELQPLFGGTLVPALDFVLPLVTDASGAASVATTWPSDLPPGFVLYAQAGVRDLTAPQGVALSNAFQGTQH